jgi:hypothetical protein
MIKSEVNFFWLVISLSDLLGFFSEAMFLVEN